MGGQVFATTPERLATALRAKHTQLATRLEHSPFQRELHLESEVVSNNLKSDIYAVVDYPFEFVNDALNTPAPWCDVIMLQLTSKYCHASIDRDGNTLTMNVGRKYFQPLENTFRIKLNYRALLTSPDYFAMELHGEQGPFSTSDYHIRVEATPIEEGRTLLHFTYSFAIGLTGRLAIRAYLLTIGRDKVGFTTSDEQSYGQPRYIRGQRGVVERSAMRYYLAIDAYLATLSTAAEDRLEARLRHWYEATEQYPRQLHEVEREEYLDMKRREYQRQQEIQ